MVRSLASPTATARLVVTLPPEPSKIGAALRRSAGADMLALTDTSAAFRHLAFRAQERLVVMIPFIDQIGAEWAIDMFEATSAPRRILILREEGGLDQSGSRGAHLRTVATEIHFLGGEQWSQVETFHAKIVLADGAAAYVGSANLLRRSKAHNLECGLLVEGEVVVSIAILIDAVLKSISGMEDARL